MWKNFLRFPPQHRRAIVIILSVFFVFALSSELVIRLKSAPQLANSEMLKLKLDSFARSLQPRDGSYYENRLNRFINQRYDTLTLFSFNPNKTTQAQFIKLGLTKKQAGNIATYLERGGRFEIKDDFRKIYGIRARQYRYLEPFLALPKKRPEKEYYSAKKAKGALAMFNPNTVTANEFVTLGFTKRQAGTLIKYQKSGASFSVKDDFKKLYFINEKKYKRYAPYLQLPDTVIPFKNNTGELKPLTLVIELNTTDTTKLVKLKGIGSYYAQKIIDYREQLGGFVHIEQIMEIKRFRESTFEQNKTYFVVDTLLVRKLNINFLNAKELAKHPYIDYGTARLIVDYRTQNGMYTSVSGLRTKAVLVRTMYNRLKPYLTTD